jgi:hypothetical protein
MSSLAARIRLVVRHRAWLAFALSATVIIALWLFIPSVYHPYLRVSSSRLEFDLACLPERIEIDIQSRYAQMQGGQITVQGVNNGSVVDTIVVPPPSDTGEAANPLQIPVFEKDAIPVTKKIEQLRIKPQFRYSIFFARTPNIDIRGIHIVDGPLAEQKCANNDYSGKELRKLIKAPDAFKRIMRYKLMQEELSDIVLLFNGPVANIFLACMLVAFLWFTYLLMSGMKRLYTWSDKALERDFKKRVESTPEELKNQGEVAVLYAQFQLQSRNFSFAKTMGPAFGFLLTVTSLSAALHPSVQATQDTFRFISGIQVAVIATAVGLAIRIVAHFGQRVYRDLAERLALLIK